jgi:hypothetical protein
LRDPLDDLLYQRPVDRRLAADPLQDGGAANGVQHLRRVNVADQVNAEADVLQDLGVDAAEPEHEERAEGGIDRHPHDQLPGGRHGRTDVEAKLGEETGSPFFWAGGHMRENYDLIYPYLRRDGTRRAMEEFTSREIYNFDLCARSLPLSGARL